MDDIFENLAEIAHDVLGTDRGRISYDTLIMEELDADSLDIVEMLSRIEDIYGIYIPDAEIIEMRTVRDAVKYIFDNTAN